MRNVGNISEVIEAYANHKQGPNRNGTGSVFFEGPILYSYGHHFPLAYANDQGIFLINGDSYSMTTSGHQNATQRVLCDQESFTTSFSTLANAGIDFEQVIIIDYTNDQSQYYRHEPIDPKSIPRNATVRWRTNRETGQEYIESWHLAASAVFMIGNKYYLAGMDEGSYFISELPCAVETVEQGFDALKPDMVKKAELSGLPIKRQGEWFAIELLDRIRPKDYKGLDSKVELPKDNQWSNGHVATRLGFFGQFAFTAKEFDKLTKHPLFSDLYGGTLVFSGALSHPEHRTLRVSTAKRPALWLLVENTAIESFSAQGVD